MKQTKVGSFVRYQLLPLGKLGNTTLFEATTDIKLTRITKKDNLVLWNIHLLVRVGMIIRMRESSTYHAH